MIKNMKFQKKSNIEFLKINQLLKRDQKQIMNSSKNSRI